MSTKRTYTLGRRAETAADTRQRLVEATQLLHWERGISGTSLRDIAERAGVSVGTAYHHFPAYLDAVRACAAHTARTLPLPSEEVFADVEGVEERVRRFVRALCGWYEANPWLERIRAERSLYPPVEESMAGLERAFEQLARAAARCTADEARTIAALVDAAVYASLVRGGMAAERVAGRMSEVVLTWLLSPSRRRSGRAARNPEQRRRHS
ncbi:MAG TPA: TetR/AcrR family transcriptional regulator [Thermoanaerobaculia bacterium]|nr:TetR/AcrR family transcriptional regulator [Thermoanaerobaculia bacterium]